MPVRLGIPESLAGAPLPRRLAWLTGARLMFLVVLLFLIGVFFLRKNYSITSFTVRAALIMLAVSFGLAGAYAGVLRSGRRISQLADAQLLLDQITWTAVVYLSGGASSGATSLYGLSVLVGAILTGMRGAALAAISAGVCFGLLLLGLQTGHLSPPPDQPASLYSLGADEVVYYVVVNLLVLVVVTLLAGNLAERLRITGGKLQIAEERALEAERMAALGRLAAGLAHEIRNPLGSIAGSIQLLKTSRGVSEEDRQLCDIVQREAARLNDLVSDMMDLARPRKPTIGTIDAAAVAREVVELASKSGRAVSDVEVRFEGEQPAPVRADGAQLRQLAWNLVRNAVQASSAGDTVRVRVYCDERDHALLAVADHGIGIDAEAKARLFDAFFTTRSQGTGVGLAVVKRIADEHGFAIEVTSERGRGATFCVDLGAVVAPAQSAPAPGPISQYPPRPA